MTRKVARHNFIDIRPSFRYKAPSRSVKDGRHLFHVPADILAESLFFFIAQVVKVGKLLRRGWPVRDEIARAVFQRDYIYGNFGGLRIDGRPGQQEVSR